MTEMADINSDISPNGADQTKGSGRETPSFPSKQTIIDYFKKGYQRDKNRMPFFWASIRHHDFIVHELTGLLFPIAEGKFRNRRAVQGVINRPDFFDTWFDKLYAADEPSSLSFIKILSAFDEMDTKPERAFVDMMLRDIEFEKLSARGLCDFIGATARLNLPAEGSILKKWVQAVGSKMEKFSNREIAISVWSLATIDARIRNPQLRDVAKIFLNRYDFSNENSAERSQINSAAIWFQLPQYRQPVEMSEDVRSELELNIRNAFERAENKIFPDRDHFLPALQRFVDIRMISGDAHVVAEVDGPFHFIRNLDDRNTEFNGSTHLQTGILGRLIPDAVIVRADYKHREFLKSSNTTGSHEFAQILTREFSHVGPGMYKTDISDGRLSLKPFFNSHALPDYAPPAEPVKRSWLSRASQVLKGLNPLG